MHDVSHLAPQRGLPCQIAVGMATLSEEEKRRAASTVCAIMYYFPCSSWFQFSSLHKKRGVMRLRELRRSHVLRGSEWESVQLPKFAILTVIFLDVLVERTTCYVPWSNFHSYVQFYWVPCFGVCFWTPVGISSYMIRLIRLIKSCKKERRIPRRNSSHAMTA